MDSRPRRSLFGAGRRDLNIISKSGSGSFISGDARRHRPDYWLLILSAALLSIGLVVVYSISPGLAATTGASSSYFVSKQLVAIGLSIVALIAATYIPIKRWTSIANPLLIAAAIGSLVVMFTPLDEFHRAHRWIKLGGLSFQIAELIKLAVLVWVARFLADQSRKGLLKDLKSSLRPLLILLAVVGVTMVKLQSDLGSTLVVAAIILVMVFMAGVPLKNVGLIFGAVAIAAVMAIGTSVYRRDRLISFFHPVQDCQSVGYQACQALIAVGSGGLVGQGLGHGVQAYGYLPEAANDSIFAIMAEKFGFIGMSVVIGIYTVLFNRLKRIIDLTQNMFNKLLVVGVLAWISTQMIINVGAMLGLLPLKGITLPLVSYGGTSLVFLTIAMGLVLQISRYTSYSSSRPTIINEKDIYHNIDGRRLRRAYNPAAVSRSRT